MCIIEHKIIHLKSSERPTIREVLLAVAPTDPKGMGSGIFTKKSSIKFDEIHAVLVIAKKNEKTCGFSKLG